MIEKIRKWVKDKAGVSPIIAIILMVAITVVLAATIYVWVSGMGGGGGGTNVALSLKQTGHSSTYLNYTVLAVNGNPGYNDIKIYINGTLVWDGSSAQNLGTGGSITVTGKTLPNVAIEPGDEIIIHSDSANGGITWKPGDSVRIVHIDSGSTIFSAEITYA